MSQSNNPVAGESAQVLRKFPMIGSTSLLVRHAKWDNGIAATDGRMIWLGEEYFALAKSDRLGVLLHEYLHVALAHPARGGLLRNKLGGAYCPTGFNIAADALINETIRSRASSGGSVTLPGGVVFSSVIKDIETLIGKDDVESITPSNVSVEKFYDLLMRAKSRTDQLSDHMDGGGGGPIAANDTNASQAERDASTRMGELFADEPDLKAQEGSFEELNDVVRDQAQRVANARATYGNVGSDMFEGLTGDLPTSKTSWKKHFRSAAARHLGRIRQKNSGRPSGAMISQHAMGRTVAWESGRKRSPQPRVLVIGDSSGSISMDDYLKFLGEAEAMRKRTGAIISFASADTQINEITRIENANDVRKVAFKGRGGTSFIQPLSYAEEQGYDLVIYLTDMDGQFPKRCRVPVIWAVTSEADAQKPHPFGRMICVN